MSRKRLLSALYWLFASLMVFSVFISAGYSAGESMLTGVLFLPGAIAIKFLLPKTKAKDKRLWRRSAIVLLLAVLLFELLLLILASILIPFGIPNRHNVTLRFFVNPVPILIILVALLAGYIFVESILNHLFPSSKEPVTFVSDRKKATLLPEEILYVESNDTEVWIYATDCRRFRNKTPISQWERLLGNDFLRIHRSYLVNKSLITQAGEDKIIVGNTSLPVSKKYKDTLSHLRAEKLFCLRGK